MKAVKPGCGTVVGAAERARILAASREYVSLPAIVILAVSTGVVAALLPEGAVLALSVVLFLGLAWMRPKWLFFAFLVLLPFSVELPAGGGAKVDLPTEALVPAVALAVGLRGLFGGRIAFLPSRLWVPVALFAGGILLSLPGSRFPVVSAKAVLRDWTHMAGGFVLPLLLIRSRGEVRRLLTYGLVSTVFLVMYGLATQFRNGIAIYQTIASPFFREHSIYGAYLCFFAAGCLGLVFSGYARSRWVLFGYLPLMVLALGLTFVRGAWLALGAGGLIVVFIYRRRVPLALVAVVVIGTALLWAAAFGLGITDLFTERMQHFADPSYVTNLDRLDRWGSAMMIWREHPALGSGWGTFAEEYFSHVHIRRAFSTDRRMGAHNLYLEMLADGGFVLLTLFLVVIAVFFHEAARVLRKVRGDPLAEGLCVAALAAVTAHLLHALVNNLGPSDKMGVLFWLALALIPVAEHLWENRPRPDGHALPDSADRQDGRTSVVAGAIRGAGARRRP